MFGVFGVVYAMTALQRLALSKFTGSTPGPLPGTLTCKGLANGHKSDKWEPSGLEWHCRLLMVGVLIRWCEEIEISLNLRTVLIDSYIGADSAVVTEVCRA